MELDLRQVCEIRNGQVLHGGVWCVETWTVTAQLDCSSTWVSWPLLSLLLFLGLTQRSVSLVDLLSVSSMTTMSMRSTMTKSDKEEERVREVVGTETALASGFLRSTRKNNEGKVSLAT